MVITILTLFPEMFTGPFDLSIIARAVKQKKVILDLVNIRDFAEGKYKSVDDHPYGGGAGMIMRVDVIDRAIKSIKSYISNVKSKTILLDPRGKTYNQACAQKFSQLNHLVLICGHYEGVDERVGKLVDETVSIGDYVLTGGEIPAMVIIDSVARLIPGVLKNPLATKNESFSGDFLEYPQYTKPVFYNQVKVPNVLLSGNHKAIAKWRREHSKNIT